MKQAPLFAEDEVRGGALARWEDLARKEARFRRARARLNSALLHRGWRVQVDAGLWVATHPELGTVRAAGPELLLRRVRSQPPGPEQLELLPPPGPPGAHPGAGPKATDLPEPE